MEIGENGVPGARAVKRVKRENSLDLVNVIHHPQSMEEENAKGTPTKQSLAIRTFLVQVKEKSNYVTCCLHIH